MVLSIAEVQAKKPLQLLTRVGAEEGFNDTLGKSEGYTEGVIDNDGTIETDGFDDGCFCRGKHISD
jgi:hypothetical protein